jgi:hypothetical protein
MHNFKANRTPPQNFIFPVTLDACLFDKTFSVHRARPNNKHIHLEIEICHQWDYSLNAWIYPPCSLTSLKDYHHCPHPSSFYQFFFKKGEEANTMTSRCYKRRGRGEMKNEEQDRDTGQNVTEDCKHYPKPDSPHLPRAMYSFPLPHPCQEPCPGSLPQA